MNLAIVILAAGDESRLKSRRPKALHTVGGKSLLSYAIETAARIVAAKDIFVVTRDGTKEVQAAFDTTGVQFVVESGASSTADAIWSVREAVGGYETVLVLPGDRPLIRIETLEMLLEPHSRGGALTSLTARASVEREQLQLSGSAGTSAVVHSGIFAAQTKPLFHHLQTLVAQNGKPEMSLAQALTDAGEAVNSVSCPDAAELSGADSIVDLVALDALVRKRIALRLMENGVTIYRPETCIIDADAEVAQDTVIEPNVQLLGKTCIGSNCLIRSGSVIENSTLADRVLIRQSCIVTESSIATGATIGPFAHLRPGSEIGEDAHVGNFVETKKARLGKGVKAGHLSYLGDAEIGAGTNIGAGVITCNYDGVRKYRTTIGEGAFIGSDSTLVAPVTIGDGAFIGAGSCITREVPGGSLAVARSRQVTKEGWAKARQDRQQNEC